MSGNQVTMTGLPLDQPQEEKPVSENPASRDTSPACRDEDVSASSPESDPEALADNEGTPRNSDSGMKSHTHTKTEAKQSKSKTQEGSTKSKKKEDKNIEHLLKALSSLSTTEEKLAALCKKYTELLEEHRVQHNALKQTQRKLNVVTREKDQLQNEHSKSILAKSKLESLCRELQRHNKLIKEESLARAREEEEKRKEVSAKFQTTINEIQTQMGENGTRNTRLKEENAELANKLKGLIEQYERREEHIEKVMKHKDLENQLAEAKLNQANLIMKEGNERHEREKLMLIEEVSRAKKKLEVLESNEGQLKTQLALYTDKYEDFQSTLTKSNEVFNSFKTEMDKMTKKIKKLEKDGTMYRTRWENSNKALLDMAEEKTKADKEMLRQNTKIMKLEKLCRALQAERNKGPGAETSGEAIEGVTADSEAPSASLEVPVAHNIQPTSTPPNTPDQSSRSSPVNVANGQVNGTETGQQSTNESKNASEQGNSKEKPCSTECSDLTEPSQNGVTKEEGDGGSEKVKPDGDTNVKNEQENTSDQAPSEEVEK